MPTIPIKVGRNTAPDYAEILRRGMAYTLRDHLMQSPSRAMLGDIFPDFPFPRPSPLACTNAILATIYLPGIREAVNQPGPLSHILAEVPDAYPSNRP